MEASPARLGGGLFLSDPSNEDRGRALLSLMLEVGTRGRMSFRPEAESREQLPSIYRTAPVGHCITTAGRSERSTELYKYAEYESIGTAGIELCQ